MDELNELRVAARNRLLCCVVGVAVLGFAAWGLTHSFLGFLAVLIVGGLPSLFAFCLSLDRYRSVYKKRFVRRTLQTYFSDLLGEMQRSLERTPDLLPVLREAGVVFIPRNT